MQLNKIHIPKSLIIVTIFMLGLILSAFIVEAPVAMDMLKDPPAIPNETITEVKIESTPKSYSKPIIKDLEIERRANITYVKTPPETIVNPDIGFSDLEMLAIVIYQEVGGDAYCDDCRYRVADVVLNRVASERFPDTLYEVLTQKSQYGRLYWTGIKWADRANDPYEADAVARAWNTAVDIYAGNHSELYGKGYIWQAEFIQGTDGFWCCGHFFGR